MLGQAQPMAPLAAVVRAARGFFSLKSRARDSRYQAVRLGGGHIQWFSGVELARAAGSGHSGTWCWVEGNSASLIASCSGWPTEDPWRAAQGSLNLGAGSDSPPPVTGLPNIRQQRRSGPRTQGTEH